MTMLCKCDRPSGDPHDPWCLRCDSPVNRVEVATVCVCKNCMIGARCRYEYIDYMFSPQRQIDRRPPAQTWRQHRAQDNLYIRLFWTTRWLAMGSAHGLWLCVSGTVRGTALGYQLIWRGLKRIDLDDVSDLAPYLMMWITAMWMLLIVLRILL